MPIAWKGYGEKTKYLMVDYRGLKSEQEMLRLLDHHAQVAQLTRGPVRSVSDFTDSSLSPRVMDRALALEQEVFAAKRSKSAVLGVGGLARLLLRGYLAFKGDRATRAFDNEAEAVSWIEE